MLEKMVMSLVVPFVFRQLDKYKGAIDWQKVQDDLNKKIHEILPYPLLDSTADELVSVAIKAIKAALAQDDAFKSIIQALIEKNWSLAFDALKSIASASVGLLASNDTEKAKALIEHIA